MTTPPLKTWQPLLVLMLALLAWGLYHAVGTYQTGGDVRKPIIVLACMFVFLGAWGVLLFRRNRRRG